MTKSLQIATNNPVYKLMADNLQLVLINVFSEIKFLTLKFYKVM